MSWDASWRCSKKSQSGRQSGRLFHNHPTRQRERDRERSVVTWCVIGDVAVICWWNRLSEYFTVGRITYIVLVQMLNHAQSINQSVYFNCLLTGFGLFICDQRRSLGYRRSAVSGAWTAKWICRPMKRSTRWRLGSLSYRSCVKSSEREPSPGTSPPHGHRSPSKYSRIRTEMVEVWHHSLWLDPVSLGYVPTTRVGL